MLPPANTHALPCWLLSTEQGRFWLTNEKIGTVVVKPHTLGRAVSTAGTVYYMQIQVLWEHI